MTFVFQDWHNNPRNPKARLVLLLFRLAQVLRRLPNFWLIFALPYLVFYRVCIEWVLGIELPWNTQIGPGLQLFHGQGLVVNDGAVLGSNCTLRNGVTIGHKLLSDGDFSRAPIIGDHVDIGAGAIIIGPINIGSYAIIGAGSVVVKDVPAHTVVAGNPARTIRHLNNVNAPSTIEN